MSLNIAVVNAAANDTFGTWITRTNEVITALNSNVVSLDSTSTGSIATGNGWVNGSLGAVILAANTIQGGNVGTPGLLTVITNTAFTANLSVTGVAAFSNTTSHTGAATFANTVAVTGAATFSATANVGANVQLSTSALRIGNSTVNTVINSVSISTASIIATNGAFSSVLDVTGAATFANTVGVTGAVSLSNTLNVTGLSTLATANVTGNARLSGTITGIGAATFANTVGITGAVTMSNTLSVTNTATFSNTISVAGAASFLINVGVNANVLISNTGYFVGNSTVNTVINSTSVSTTDLILLGNASVGGTLGVTGAATFTASANVGANVQLSTSRLHIGNSTVNTVANSTSVRTTDGVFSGNLTVNGTITINGATTINGQSIVMNANASVSQNASLINYRPDGGDANTAIRWYETGVKWQLTNDGTNYYDILNLGNMTDITALGTIATGVWNGTIITAAYGGTGRGAATANGQLHIANSTGGFDLARLTAGTNITIDNATGAVTINANTVGGSNTYVQFNDSGAHNGTAGMVFNKTSNNFIVANTITGAILVGSIDATNVASGTLPSARLSGSYTGVTGLGTIAGLTVSANLNLTGNLFVNQLYGTPARIIGAQSNISADTTSNNIALQVEAYYANVASTKTESGYRVGLNVEGYISDAGFTGTLADHRGLWVRHGSLVANSGSVITNEYGIYLEGRTNANTTITNHYGIYQSHASANNYFAGSMNVAKALATSNTLTTAGGITVSTVGNDVTSIFYGSISLRNTTGNDGTDSFQFKTAEGTTRAQFLANTTAFNIVTASLPLIVDTGTGAAVRPTSSGVGDLGSSSVRWGNLFLSANATIAGNVAIAQQLAVTNSVSFSNTLAVTGLSTLGTANVTGQIMINGNIVGPATSFATTWGANPAASITSGGFIQLYGSAASGGNTVVLGANGAAIITANSVGVTVALPTTFSSTTVHTGAATFSSNLYASDTSAFHRIGQHLFTSYATELGYYGSGNNTVLIDFRADDTYTDYALRILRANDGPNARSEIVHRGTGILYLTAQDAGSIYFKTNDVARAYIDSNGLVVLGANSYTQNNYNGSIYHSVYNANSGASALSAVRLQTLTSSSYVDFKVYDNAAAPYFQISSGTGILHSYYDSPDHIFRSAAASNYMIANSTGLTVTGIVSANATTITANSGAGGKLSFVDNAASGAQSWQVGPGAGSGSAAEFNIYNNTTSTLIYQFGKTGNFTAAGDVLSNSDRDLKKNIKYYTNKTKVKALDVVNKLLPASYQMKADEQKLTKYGLIAQDVEQVLPDLVYGSNGKKSIAYLQLIAVLVQAVKELDQKVTKFEKLQLKPGG